MRTNNGLLAAVFIAAISGTSAQAQSTFPPPRNSESETRIREGDGAAVRRLIQRGQFIEAFAAAEAMAAKYPDAEEPGHTMALIGAALGNVGQVEQGDTVIDRAVELRPNVAEIRNNACWYKAINKRDLDRALTYCQEAVRLDSDNGRMSDSLGFVHLQRGEYAEAIAAYDYALKVRPGSAYSLYGRGLAKLRVGDKTAGNADLRAARVKSSTISQEFRFYGLKP